jgi:hypothetical protein
MRGSSKPLWLSGSRAVLTPQLRAGAERSAAMIQRLYSEFEIRDGGPTASEKTSALANNSPSARSRALCNVVYWYVRK